MDGDSLPYSLSANEHLLERLHRLIERATELGIQVEWASTLKAALDRLKSTPKGAGDPMRRLRGLQLTEYRLLFEQVRIIYTVHDTARIVFIQSVDPILGHPLEGAE